ncbi:phospholipase D family protein [Acinetobacter ursingii]|uniref:phospholipase D family protein n=1 Tax=Acinetobacter ursingii TaxID=108980 RepID=UPI0021CD503E|nr:phospholipase D family protein [Acinetobacter ursingii]MCU4481619.1 phospholipase D family protein [Acinetobacter ursingii]MCU4506062.1 phospholipase D family protein [Acinetobacter ursingii]MCU4568738.1 phospholipase D family protein [Acinetobacter ursingii]
MAKFLNTSATNYYLEELIKSARERVILISPFLKLNDRVKELLEDKNRLKIDIRIIYGKSELQPEEISWLREQDYIRTSFCKNLHAKCYLNEDSCIITSLNLYEFSQINNNEMGILVEREEDTALYKDTYEEAQRIIRISDEIRISMEKIENSTSIEIKQEDSENSYEKLTSSKLASKLGVSTAILHEKLTALEFLSKEDEHYYLTEKGKALGAEFKKGKFGIYFLWPENLKIS